jgi:hypothetical protein
LLHQPTKTLSDVHSKTSMVGVRLQQTFWFTCIEQKWNDEISMVAFLGTKQLHIKKASLKISTSINEKCRLKIRILGSGTNERSRLDGWRSI